MTAVQWGAWTSAGMASAAVLGRLQRTGQGALPPAVGLAALATVLRGLSLQQPTAGPAPPLALAALPPRVVTVNPFVWEKYLQTVGGSSSAAVADGSSTWPHPLYAFFADAVAERRRRQEQHEREQQAVTAAAATTTATGTPVDPTGRLQPSSPQVLQPPPLRYSREAVRREVQGALAEVLGAPLPDSEPLMSAGGLDSLGAVEYVNLLGRRLGGAVPLPATLIFDYPTPGACDCVRACACV